MKYSIPVATRLQDNGAGGYTLYCYNNNDELLANHPLGPELTEKQKSDILNEDDPYENGYIGKSNIEIEVVDGVAKLAKETSFRCGQ